jgi:hypothetical protein
MNKNEKAIADSIAAGLFEEMSKLSEAINLNSIAVQYLADVTGHKADKKKKLELVTPAPEPAAPLVETPPMSEEQIMLMINDYAAKNGKDSAYDIVKKFVLSMRIEDIPKSRYKEFVEEVSL